MVAVKSHQAEAFLKALDRVPGAVLFYGSDAGLVSERSARLAQRLAEREQGEVLRFDDTDLEVDPDRLSVELRTMAMFGGRKIVRAIAGRRLNTNLVKPLVEEGNLEGFLIVEGGNLRPDEGMRALFEKSGNAAAVACFPDEARDLDAMVGDVLAAARARITPEAKKLLVARLGADRALSRGEVEKLALFARDKPMIEESDVEAIVGDAAEMALDRVVMAAGSGKTADALGECDRVIAAGESAQGIIAALQRHFIGCAAGSTPASPWTTSCGRCDRRRTSSKSPSSNSNAGNGRSHASIRRWPPLARPHWRLAAKVRWTRFSPSACFWSLER
jgi:DNA polymerase-3 subunit delta